MIFLKQSDRFYSKYSKSLWDGKVKKSNIFKEKWLTELQRELPELPFRSLYIDKVALLRSRETSDTSELEQNLLNRRFSFSAEIEGKNYLYRELQGATETAKHEALIRESELLIENGFDDLVKQRNTQAVYKGFKNYWQWKNPVYGGQIEQFLVKEDIKNIKINSSQNYCSPHTGRSIEFDEALEFYCSSLFSEAEIPEIKLLIRTGDRCPPAPPFVQPIHYRPISGHTIGINLPFIHQNHFNNDKLSSFFHELTHLFHFGAVDARGGYAFPPELAGNDLLYESEALCYQNLLLASWNKTPYIRDLDIYKDLIYVAETERQLYSLANPDKKNIKELLHRRIKEHYPMGNFKRTPLGASHLIREESAGRYWIYGAAYYLADKRINQILTTEKFLSPPYYWSEGNEASWRIEPEKQLTESKKGILFNKTAINPDDLKRRDLSEIRQELKKKLNY